MGGLEMLIFCWFFECFHFEAMQCDVKLPEGPYARKGLGLCGTLPLGPHRGEQGVDEVESRLPDLGVPGRGPTGAHPGLGERIATLETDCQSVSVPKWTENGPLHRIIFLNMWSIRTLEGFPI